MPLCIGISERFYRLHEIAVAAVSALVILRSRYSHTQGSSYSRLPLFFLGRQSQLRTMPSAYESWITQKELCISHNVSVSSKGHSSHNCVSTIASELCFENSNEPTSPRYHIAGSSGPQVVNCFPFPTQPFECLLYLFAAGLGGKVEESVPVKGGTKSSSALSNCMCLTKGATPIDPYHCPRKRSNGSEDRPKNARNFIGPHSHPTPTEDKPP
jgi:hypothetical protein